MRIESIHIRGFGRLSDRRIEFPEGRAALVVEENEAGKSTLAAAIIAGLCGFPARRATGEKMKLSDVYKPWDGGPYALTMTLDAGGRRWIVERDFARGSFVVRDPETNRDVSADFDSDLAVRFLGLGREDLMRIAHISGKDVSRFSSSTSLRERLAVLVEGSSTDTGAETAIASLERASYHLDGRDIKPETAITRLTRSIEQKSTRLRELDTILDAAGEDVRALEEAQTRQEQLSARLHELDEEYGAARLRDVRGRISAAENAEAEIRALQDEAASLEEYATFPAERKEQLTRATERFSGWESRLRDLQGRLDALSAREAELQARVDESRQFAVATEDDVVALAAAEDGLRNARDEMARAEQAVAVEKRSASRLSGRVLATVGVAIGLAGVVLMVMQVLDVGPSAIGVAVGVAIAAVGLVQLSRAGARGAQSKARLQQAESLLAGSIDRAIRLLAPIGVQCVDGADPVDLLARTRDALSRSLRDRDALRTTRLDAAAVSREMDQVRTAIREERDAIRSILVEAGVDASLPLDEAMRAFDMRERSFRRRREIRESLLPKLETGAMSPEALDRLRTEEAELSSRYSAGASARTTRTPAEVDSERQTVRLELEELSRRVRELDGRVGAVVEGYRREYPSLLEELSGLRTELARAKRFDGAVRLAADVLREVAASTRRRWAAALNARVGEILPHLNPGYGDIRFDDNLGFTLRHIADGRIMDRPEVDVRLSAGAKDQVYLAVRLACCLELSASGEALPIILDDPLTAFDDSKFASALRYLVEVLGTRQQVIILTCHRSRHERLASESWFGDGVAVVDLAP